MSAIELAQIAATQLGLSNNTIFCLQLLSKFQGPLFAAIVFVSCTKDPVKQKTGTPSGNKVITFVTSDATDVGCVNSELTATYPDIKWIEGLRLNGMSDADLQAWVEACLSDKQK